MFNLQINKLSKRREEAFDVHNYPVVTVKLKEIGSVFCKFIWHAPSGSRDQASPKINFFSPHIKINLKITRK